MVVYILYSKVLKQYYVGQTGNLQKRIDRHNRGGVLSTKRGVPWKIITTFDAATRSEAVQLERKIKKRGIERFLIDNQFGV